MRSRARPGAGRSCCFMCSRSVVGDRHFRPGRTSSSVRPVSVSLPHDDRIVGSDLLGGIRSAEPESAVGQADKRKSSRLTDDLLAEREITAVQLLHDIAGHLKVRTTITPEQLRDLILLKKTDLRQLTNQMEEWLNQSRRPYRPSLRRAPSLPVRRIVSAHLMRPEDGLSICYLRSGLKTSPISTAELAPRT